MKAKRTIRLFMGIVAILALVGCGDDGGHGTPPDPCAGPVPCLTEDWGMTGYIFEDRLGEPYAVVSDGTAMAVVGFVWWTPSEYVLVGLAGPSIDCHNGEFLYAAFWSTLPPGDIPDYETLGVQGKLNICGVTLTISDLSIPGWVLPDLVATYVGTETLAEVGTLWTLPPGANPLKRALERFHEWEDE